MMGSYLATVATMDDPELPGRHRKSLHTWISIGGGRGWVCPSGRERRGPVGIVESMGPVESTILETEALHLKASDAVAEEERV